MVGFFIQKIPLFLVGFYFGGPYRPNFKPKSRIFLKTSKRKFRNKKRTLYI